MSTFKQFSLRVVVLIVTLLAMVLSGAFANPICILIALAGVIFFWTGMNHEGGRLLGVIAGAGWIGMAAVIDYLLRLPNAP